MRKPMTSFRAGMAAMLLILTTAAWAAADEKIPLNKVPKPVIEAVKARLKGSQILSVHKEKERGKVVYEVAIRHSGSNADVVVTPEGKILLVKRQLAAADLPRDIRDAV